MKLSMPGWHSVGQCLSTGLQEAKAHATLAWGKDSGALSKPNHCRRPASRTARVEQIIIHLKYAFVTSAQ